MPTKDNCSRCGKVVARSAASLEFIVCQRCRAGEPAESGPYVPPARVDRCAECGVTVQRSWTSADRIVCRVCRRKRPRVAKPQSPTFADTGCPTCGIVFTPYRSTQVYCAPACRPNRASGPKAPSSARGYGTAHQRERRKWKLEVDTGHVDCARCGQRILPGELWDLDHTEDRTDYLGPSHRGCNRSAGARKGNTRTDHLRWQWRQCEDCGGWCYGVKCKECRARYRRSA